MLEKLVVQKHYNTDDGCNPDFVAPRVCPATVLRENENTDVILEPLVPVEHDPKLKLNDAPTLAMNKLLGQPFFRNLMEGIWFGARSQMQHPAQGITDFVTDGGLRQTAFSHGNRIPYVGADLRLHPLAVVPVATLSHNKLLLMATSARMFNLQAASTVRCNQAIIRFDQVHFMDETMQMLRPRIESNLVTLKWGFTKNPGAPKPRFEYQFSLNGGEWQSTFLQSGWDILYPILQNADFAQVYVPTDFSATQIQQAHLREFSKEQKKIQLAAKVEEQKMKDVAG